MKLVYLTVTFFHLLIGLNVAICGLLRETGCPPPEDVAPCICNTSPFVHLGCKNIQNADVLRRIFENSARYTYVQVYLEKSSIQYLPHEMFDYASVSGIVMIEVTLVKLFDKPPLALDKLQTLVISGSRVLSGMSWELLEPFTQLKRLSIYHTNVRTVTSNFSRYVSKSLEMFDFFKTDTRRLNPGILTEFHNLDRIIFSNCKLTELSRNMFPVPFIGKELEFHDNRITSIPDDLFTQMPNLELVELSDNLISTIPEAAFDGNFEKVTSLLLDGNPLKCDCLLVWIIRNKPEKDLSGSCRMPKRLHGKELIDLSTSDFNC